MKDILFALFLATSVACFVGGASMVYPPAGVIVGGIIAWKFALSLART